MKKVTKVISKIHLRTWIALTLIAILLPVIAFVLYSPSDTSAEWYNESWQYRKEIRITNNTTAETSVYIAFDSTDVIDTSIAGFNNDCSDLRFTDNGGKLLPYIINSGCDTSSTDIDVFFENFPAGAQNIYMYYGNSSAVDQQSSAFSTEATNYTIGTPGSAETGPGPIAYWKFDEGVDNTCSGGTNDACDSVSNYDGLKGSSTWETEDLCLSGKCITFNGPGTEVTGTTIPVSDYPFTVSTWIRTTDANGRIFMLADADADESQTLTVGVSTARLLATNSGSTVTANSGITVDDGKWHHIVGVWSSTTSRSIYVDGVLAATSTSSSAFSAGIDNWCISNDCSSSGDNALVGQIDEVKVYPYARSADQIKADFAARGSVKGVSAQFGPDNSFLSDGLVGYWKMNDDVTGTGQTIDDSSGNNYDGTTSDSGSTLDCSVAGQFGYGCDMDGTDDLISVSDNADFSPENITIAAWFNIDQLSSTKTSDQYIVNHREGASPFNTAFIQVDSSDDKIYATFDNETDTDSTSVVSDTAVAANTWYHVASVWDGTRHYLYVNGVLQSSTDTMTASSIHDMTGNFNIGAATSGVGNLDGTIDETRIYNRALSPDEIYKLYNWAPGPVGHWKMDENTGTTAFDVSGNASNGTLTNSPTWVPGKYGSAVNTNKTFAHVTMGDPSSGVLDFAAASDFSFGGWMKTSTIGTSMAVIEKNYDGVGGGYRIRIDTAGKPACGLSDPDQVAEQLSANTVIADGDWHHVVCVIEGSASTPSMYIYVDGLLEASAALTSSNGAHESSVAFTLGINSDASYFRGSQDDVRVYNYDLTQAQIVEYMNAGHPLGGSPVGSQWAYWSFDSAPGQNIYDKSINAFHGTLGVNTGSSTDDPTPLAPSSCKINGCLDFDGGDNVLLNGAAQFDIADGSDLSLTGWFYKDTFTTDTTIISNKNSTSNTEDGFYVYVDGTTNDRLIFSIGDGTNGYQMTSTQSFTATGWHHYAITWDADNESNTRMYIDGVEEAVTTSGTHSSVGAADTANDLVVGSESDGGLGWEGRLDEIKIYSGTLSRDEVLIDMNGGSSSNFGTGSVETDDLVDTYVAPVAYFPLDENTGTASVYDYSGNGYVGSLIGHTENDWGPGVKGSGLHFDGSAGTTYDDIVIEATNTSTVTTASTSHTVSLPTGVSNGDLLIVLFGMDHFGSVTNTTTWPAGWTELFDEDDTDVMNFSAAYRRADGTEGSTISVTSSASDLSAHISYRLSGHHSSTNPESSVLQSSGTTPNPPSLNPSNWDAEDTFWIAGFAADRPTDSFPTTDDPDGYTNALEANTADASGVDARSVSRINNTSTEDPTTFTLTASEQWIATTIGVRPGTVAAAQKYVDVGTGPTDVNSISFWINPDSTTTQHIMNLTGTTDYIWINNGTVTAQGLSSPTIYVNGQQTSSVVAGEWQHVVITTATSENASNFELGRTADSSSNYLEGKLDEVKLWSNELTASQIAYEYNRGKPIAHWKFDECQGATANDASGNGYSGTIDPVSIGNTTVGTCGSGTATEMWNDGTTGKLNSGLGFDGDDDQVEVSSSFTPPTGDFTYSLWFKHDANSSDYMFSITNGTDNEVALSRLASGSGGAVRFSLNGTTSQCSGGRSLTLGQWYHYAVTRNGSSINAFLNGEPDGTCGSDGAPLVFSTCKFYIGTDDDSASCAGNSFSSEWAGILDDLRIYNYPLTQAQIRKVMLGGDAGSAVRFGD